MNRDELESKLHKMISSCNKTSQTKVAENVSSMMQLIDEYVEREVIKARLEVMKNFGAI